MGEVLLWLVLGGLLVWLFFLAVQRIKLSWRKQLLVIEPLGGLIKDWQVARFEPNTESLKRQFKALAQANLSTGSLLEGIIIAAAAKTHLKSQASQLILIDHQLLAPLAERFIVESDNHKRSIIIGPLGQIAELIEDEKLNDFHHISLQAAEHGFLALTIATAFVQGGKKAPAKHELEGLIILEPIIDRSHLPTSEPVRFLTVAPLQFAHNLYEQLFPHEIHFGLNAKELETLAPKFAEADLEKASVIGSADLNARHRVLQSWQRLADCRYISVNQEDQNLPASSFGQLP